MIYTLMHKNIPAADIEIDESGTITKVIETKEPSHLPVGVHCENGITNRRELSRW